ncbi:TPA: phosphonopyruvate decarboxylase [Candidatus Woesearchaeota archaeon]|nr:phosphonopyruvate decarboxylase [Candidatus Woesearchaeota archaeon]
MIPCDVFYAVLKSHNLTFFAGVPDSLLKDFCAYIADNADKKDNIITANEGNAIALAAGYYLATGKIGVVYMQNSGEGNAVNPLMSLVDPDVYSIPVLLIIGWRGEPGVKDEPQHVKQGKITLELLETLGIPYEILPEDSDTAKVSVEKAVDGMKKRSAPYALVVKKNTFAEYKLQSKAKTSYELSREDALKLVVDALNDTDIVVSTTGKTSRELFEYREELRQNHSRDFLTVGSMGHSSSIALGIALQKPDRQVFCFDGDGAVIMHMGSLAISGQLAPKNFKHIVFNNGSHDSVGGQPTTGFGIDLPVIAKANGYRDAHAAKTREEIQQAMATLRDEQGPVLLEIRVNKGARKDLGRPTTTPIQNKQAFMKFIQ